MNKLLSEENDFRKVLRIVDETLMNLAKNATSNAFVSVGDVEINVILANQSLFNRDELNMGNNSAITVESVDIPNNNLNSNFALVVAKLTNRRSYQQREDEKLSEISETLLGIPGSSYLSINAFDKVNNKETTANVSYSRNQENDSTAVKQVDNQRSALSERKVVVDADYTCQFFNESDLAFLTTGCSANNQLEDRSQVTCSCNHTTVFAVLLSVSNYTIPSGVRVGIVFLLCLTLCS